MAQVIFYTDASGRVTLNGAPLAPPEAAQLLGILSLAHDRAMREGDRLSARSVRTLSLDLMAAMDEVAPPTAPTTAPRTASWTAPPTAPSTASGIPPVRPVNITVRALDPARWAAVPGDAA